MSKEVIKLLKRWQKITAHDQAAMSNADFSAFLMDLIYELEGESNE